MPRNATTTDRVERSRLPEFLRSVAIGAVIAEALDNHNVVGETAPGAVTSMIGDAAREVRIFHGLPLPSHQQGTAPRLARVDDYSPDGWDRNDPAENAEAQA